MSAKFPSYMVPEEIKQLVKERFFLEFTQPGDPVRSFGMISSNGNEVRLWVDREEFNRRRMTGMRYTVSKTDEQGKLLYESSCESLSRALGRFRETVTRGDFGVKEWRPMSFLPRPGLYSDR